MINLISYLNNSKNFPKFPVVFPSKPLTKKASLNAIWLTITLICNAPQLTGLSEAEAEANEFTLPKSVPHLPD